VGHLEGALSPYLEAHRDNPIDWYPWGPEAFEEARRRDVPVMISIGYHTCHWCHVMARESFSDQETGSYVNDRLVSIKVDREEHPDVDQHFLTQAAAFIEQLGWPLTVFTTPAGDAFHAATYLPPEQRGDTPSFRQVVDAVSTAWSEQKEKVLDGAQSLRDAIRAADQQAKDREPVVLGREEWQGVIHHLVEQEDREHGGLGVAPKFPIAPVLQFLLLTDDPAARGLARRVLDAMAASPLRDAVDGGFFRYATQRDWSEPHYERMLYDNALLLWCYATVLEYRHAQGIVGFLRQTLRIRGGFASAQDSESIIDGQRVEGEYYRSDATTRQTLAPPARDDKVLAGWNGLALSGLARARLRGVPGDLRELGDEVASELLATHRDTDGRLHRMSRDGVVSPAASTLEDYGGLALGLLEWGLATGEVNWLLEAQQLVDSCLHDDGFIVPGGGDPTIQALEAVSGDVSEGATPSGLALIATAAHALAQLTGTHTYREVASTAVAPYAEAVRLRPLAFGGLAAALWRVGSPDRELVVVSDDPGSELAQTARELASPSLLVAIVSPAQAEACAEAGFSLFEGRAQAGAERAYLCDAGVCGLPHTSAESLRSALVAD
jgi:uncharacterized protein YyaL (SSP411 family)